MNAPLPPPVSSSAAAGGTLAPFSHRRRSSSAPTTRSLLPSSSSACAACKFQRRKCTPDCLLAPYFPADQNARFQSAHRLFGVSKIKKILETVAAGSRSEAMSTIIFQSEARARDPVGGCYRLILELERQIDICFSELQNVLRQIAFFRAQVEPPAISSLYSNLDIAATPGDHHPQQSSYNYLLYGAPDQSEEHAPEIGVDDHGGGYNEMNGFEININGEMELPPEIALEDVSRRLRAEGGDHEDVKPLVEKYDARHAFATGEDDLISSRIEMKDDENSLGQIQENDLKTAASLFTLTNCNTFAHV
ncbi:LOB domain-containing protein 22 [Apostasia shenzhenica]|uniref:LOB domain-containing protein 22 n=1 Tax=Apostasia shenzhenica TaxID=1088818 RepID=A0A2I0B776_9ASPA|nr:LOB domain-containing protein 22 [Apostasia shenzhenica]